MAKKLTKMNYKDAYFYFQTGTDKEKYRYIMSVPRGPVCDFRNLEFPTAVLDKMIAEKAFILIDGASGTGKTTLAQEIQKHYGEDKVAVLDIDYICKDYLESMQRKLSKLDFLKFIYQFQEKTDQYVADNLENMVKKVADEGKSAIVVGSYIFIIARAVMGYTLGMKYFPNTFSITLVEKEYVIFERLKIRGSVIDHNQVSFEIAFLEQVIEEDISSLGVGTTLTVVANTNTKWW